MVAMTKTLCLALILLAPALAACEPSAPDHEFIPAIDCDLIVTGVEYVQVPGATDANGDGTVVICVPAGLMPPFHP